MDHLKALAPAADFAEHLSRRLGVVDAIALHAALDGSAAPLSPSRGSTPASGGIAAGIAQVRTALENTIASAFAAEAGTTRLRFPEPAALVAGDAGVSYLPCLAFHRTASRQLEQRLGVLRAKVREALSRASPPMRQLAALDEVMEKALASLELSSIAEIPALLEQRFTQLHMEHRQSLAIVGSDDPHAWIQPGAWLARFRDEIKAVLHAELDLRLQPVIGLAEALANETGIPHE